jgi:hypothetical protein
MTASTHRYASGGNAGGNGAAGRIEVIAYWQ